MKLMSLMTAVVIAVPSLVMTGCNSDDIDEPEVKKEQPSDQPDDEAEEEPGENGGNEWVDPEYNPLVLSDSEKEIADKQKNYGIRTFQKLLSEGNERNMVFSPLNATSTLSLIANASDGTTRKELLDVLGYSDIDALNAFNKHVLTAIPAADALNTKMSLANAIWLNKDKEVEATDAFTAIMKDYYNAPVYKTSFVNDNISNIVNAWASENTNGLIKNVVGDEVKHQATIMANALYFKSPWTHKFDTNNTTKARFENAGDVDMMYGQKFSNVYYSTSHGVGTILEYGNSAFEFVIVVPDNKSNMAQALDEVLNAKSQNAIVDVYMPRFELESTLDLTNTLSALGVDMSKLNLSNLKTIGMPMEASQLDVRQKALIKVDEEGSEAAAVTASWATGLPDEKKPEQCTVRADRPFAFAIRESSSRVVLFMGAVYNPNK